jgi:hypothetical protein
LEIEGYESGQARRRAAERIELPDDQHIALASIIECAVQAGSVGSARRVVESHRLLITSRAWRLSQPWAHIIFQAD